MRLHRDKEAGMTILLSILKWLGIILLILLLIILILIILVMFVPFRYRLQAEVDDPETHEEFPVSVLKERSDVLAEVSWLLGALRIIVTYPSKEILCVKIFGKDIGIMNILKKESSEEPEEEEEEGEEAEEEETSLEEKVDALTGKAEKVIGAVDYAYRVLTGSCSRRATDKVIKRLKAIVLHVLPDQWEMSGTVGLSDPSLNGRTAGLFAILSTIADDRMQMQTEWEQYRCDLKAEIGGYLRLIVPVKEALPLIFDKDCRKMLRKLKKVKAKLN